MSQNHPSTDDRLLDWLYGELDEKASAQFEAELAKDPVAMEEAASFRRTREILAQAQEQDPPPSLSSALLHAAAKEVAGVKASPGIDSGVGFFGRMLAALQSLGARPGLAAAAGLVVVVGVAGALYVRGDLASTADRAQADRPEVAAAEAARPAQSQPTTLAQEGGDPADQAPASVPSLAQEETVALDDGVEGESDRIGYLADEKQSGELRRQAVAQQKRDEPKLAYERKERKAAETAEDSSRTRVAKPDGIRKNKKAMAKGGPAADPFEFAKKPAMNAPDSVANAVSSGDYSSSLGGAVASKDEAGAPGDSRLSTVGAVEHQGKFRPYSKRQELDDAWAREREATLSKVVKGKDCTAAARIANDILDRHPEYYYQHVKGSAEVKKCQWYVAAESKRRSQLRSKKGAGDGSSATAAPAKSAPKRRARDDMEAADTAAE